MSVMIAFLAGTVVSTAAFILPHARSNQSSVENFQAFQSTLATLPVARSKKQSSRVR